MLSVQTTEDKKIFAHLSENFIAGPDKLKSVFKFLRKRHIPSSFSSGPVECAFDDLYHEYPPNTEDDIKNWKFSKTKFLAQIVPLAT